MNDNLDLKKRLIIVILIVLCAISMLYILIAAIYMHMNEVNQNSIECTPNKFFCPLGEEIGTPVIIKLKRSNEVFHQDYNVGDIFVSSIFSAKPTLDLANTMYTILQDNERRNNANRIGQIEIPKEACYIGSVDTTSTSADRKFISDLDFDILHTDIQLYAWNKQYQLNSGKEGDEIHIIMILNDNVIYGKIQMLGNTNMQMDILYGCKN
jgi:hypothetical protein